MITYKATANKPLYFKWLIYILLGIGILIYIFEYSDWHYISKFLFAIPLLINLIFDLHYYRKTRHRVVQLIFKDTLLEIIDHSAKKTSVSYPHLKYSIRKRKFDKHKTEIELKTKKGIRFKTCRRLHITNWENIFEIEQELNQQHITRTEWKPMTLWGKYWGMFIDLIFLSSAGQDVGMTAYHENAIKDVTENPIEEDESI